MSVHKSADTCRTRALPHELIPRQSFPPGECIALNRAMGAGRRPPSDTTQNLILISPALEGPRFCRCASREQNSPPTRSLHHRGCQLQPQHLYVQSCSSSSPDVRWGVQSPPLHFCCKTKGNSTSDVKQRSQVATGKRRKEGGVGVHPDTHFGNPASMFAVAPLYDQL